MNKNAGVTVAANAIEKAGIQGDDLFDGLLNDKILEEDLGVDSAHKRAKILRALDALDKQGDWREPGQHLGVAEGCQPSSL